MRAVLCALVFSLFAACGSGNKLDTGEVVEKHIEAGYDYVTQMCVSRNAQGICTLNMPVWHNVPSKYRILVEGYHDGERLTEWHTIDDDYWNELQRGDTWVDE